MCRDCETHLSKSETYVDPVLYGGAELDVSKSGNCLFISGLNYFHVRMFFLSVLWRMSVSSIPFFSEVSLGSHENRIRRMLLADDPGEPCDYGFGAMIPLIEGRFHPDLIINPDRLHVGARTVYRVVIGGIVYVFFISSLPAHARDSNLLIQKNGEWVMQYALAQDCGIFLSLAKQILRKDEKYLPVKCESEGSRPPAKTLTNRISSWTL
jgi:hypothetical protein